MPGPLAEVVTTHMFASQSCYWVSCSLLSCHQCICQGTCSNYIPTPIACRGENSCVWDDMKPENRVSQATLVLWGVSQVVEISPGSERLWCWSLHEKIPRQGYFDPETCWTCHVSLECFFFSIDFPSLNLSWIWNRSDPLWTTSPIMDAIASLLLMIFNFQNMIKMLPYP